MTNNDHEKTSAEFENMCRKSTKRMWWVTAVLLIVKSIKYLNGLSRDNALWYIFSTVLLSLKLEFKDVIATYTRLMLMFMLYVIAAAIMLYVDSFNRLCRVYDTHVTTILKVFMKMLHLHSMYLFVSYVRQSLSTYPMEIPGLQRWAGWGGLECGIEKLKTYSTYHSVPDDYSSRLFLEWQWKIK